MEPGGRSLVPERLILQNFTDLGLSAPLLKTLAKEGYETPTPIQQQAIPPVLAGKDLLGIAQTGTGKTAAFALPIIHRLMAEPRRPNRRACRVLVLAPTRELTNQIAESFKTYGSGTALTVAVVVGGVKYGGQIRALAPGVDVLVATPGRLLDHLGQGTVRLDETEVFVLDEADQMLDLGFVEPIRKVVKKLPARRQNLFFSATMPKTIGDLANEILHNPQEVRVTPQATTVEKVVQKILHVEAGHKRDLLVELLAQRDVSRAIVFTRTKHGADKLTQYLEKAGLSAAAIHGNKSQGQRERALAAFKAGKVQSLIATDIAARGIDVDGVSHVFQYELPNVPEAYVHRIGRTARAGAGGQAITLCDHSERNLLRDIERLTKLEIPAEDRRLDQSRPLAAAKSEGERDAGKAKKRNARGRGGPGPSHRGQGGRDGGASASSESRSSYGAGQAKPRPAQPARRSEWSPVESERAKPAAARPSTPRPQAPAAASAGYGYRGPKRREA